MIDLYRLVWLRGCSRRPCRQAEPAASALAEFRKRAIGSESPLSLLCLWTRPG